MSRHERHSTRRRSPSERGAAQRWSGRIEGRAVKVNPTGLIVPAECACCGAVASSSRVERTPTDGLSVIVPYCDACQRHASSASTRVLASTLASCVLGGTLAAVLPLLWQQANALALAALALLGALLPLAVALRHTPRREAGHTSGGRAVWWLPNGELFCASPAWAESLAAAQNSTLRPVSLRDRPRSPWMVTGPVLALVVAPFFYWLHRPLVRVVNLTSGQLTVLVDGAPLATLEPTSAESPAAGVEIRMPAGTRQLVAVDSRSRTVARATVQARAGRQHLYAPGSDAYCFWLETVGYGQAGAQGLDRVPLLRRDRFWVLPQVDAWFAPNPPPSPGDDRSSGGTRTALRQSPCREAPASVRAAATEAFAE